MSVGYRLMSLADLSGSVVHFGCLLLSKALLGVAEMRFSVMLRHTHLFLLPTHTPPPQTYKFKQTYFRFNRRALKQFHLQAHNNISTLFQLVISTCLLVRITP